MSSKMTPTDVVSMLNDLFSIFDEIVEQYSLNKIKTIGDCVSDKFRLLEMVSTMLTPTGLSFW